MLTSNSLPRALQRHSPGERAYEAIRPGFDQLSKRDYFGCAADAAAEAASAAALAAAAESAAAEAAESEAAAGGGVVSVVGAGASVLLPQALKTNAAARALKASLVFIYRYPRNLMTF
jgi:hypothetical protein